MDIILVYKRELCYCF